MKLRVILMLALCSAQFSCDQSTSTMSSSASSVAAEDGWDAAVAFVEGREGLAVQVKMPSDTAFADWRGGQPIPPGSTIKTGPFLRARLAVEGGEIILNHDTELELVVDPAQVIKVLRGHAVFDMNPERESKTKIILPTGDVVLHGTKISALAGQKESVVSVSQGEIRVKYGELVLEAMPGQEIILPAQGPPRIGGMPDLGREMGWSQLVDPDDQERVEVDRGLGKLVGKTPGGEREWKLEMVRHGVEAKVQGNMAYTEIHESFKNPTGHTLEGVYRFPLPADAQISRLSLKVGGRWMEGEFVETKRAEWIWRDVISTWRDPAMLKWKHGNTFELRIFPIGPHAIREIKIGYVQELEASEQNRYVYTYPMPVDYAGLIKANTFDFAATIYGHDPTMPIDVSGYPATIGQDSTKDDKAITRVKYTANDFYGAGDLVIEFGRKRINGVESYSYRPSSRRERSFGLVSIRPQFEGTRTMGSRDFVIVADTSYARRGGVMRLQADLAARLVDEMDPLDRVALMSCATRCEPVAGVGFSGPTSERSTAVRAALTKREARGSSNAVEVLRMVERLALTRRGQANTRPLHVIYLTDGIFSAGELRPGQLGAIARKVLLPLDARLSVVDLGGDTDASLQDALAAAGRGAVLKIDPSMSRTGQALTVLSHHYGSTLTDVTIETPAGFVDVYPKTIAALSSGEEIALVGRFVGDVRGDIVVRGQTGGQKFEARYPVDLSAAFRPGNSFVSRSWAVRKIRDLELDGAPNKRAIVSLSQRYGVLTRFTTLLALEDEQMMREYGVRKRDVDDWDGQDASSTISSNDSGGTARTGDGRGVTMDDKTAPSPSGRAGNKNRPMSRPMGEEMNEQTPKGQTATRGSRRPRAKNESKKRGPRSPAAIETERPQVNIDDVVKSGESIGKAGLGMGGAKPYAIPPLRRRVQRVSVRAAKPTTKAERRRIQQKSAALAKDPDNRSRRMQLIRAQIRAGEFAAADRQIASWVNTNPMDAEALVQQAQLLSQRGQVFDALKLLASAVDAAPRGQWIQMRIQRAYEATGDEALACAHRVSLVGVTGKGDAKSEDCALATDLSLFEIAPEQRSTITERKASKRASGALVLDLTWSGQGDLDILVVEPDGRTISWLSQRRRVKVYGVRGGAHETLVLPALRTGTYGVRIVRADGGSSALQATLKVKTFGETKTFDVVHAQPGLDVAEVNNQGWGMR